MYETASTRTKTNSADLGLETVNLISLGRLIVLPVHPFLVKSIGNSLELTCSIIFLFLPYAVNSHSNLEI